MNPSCTCEPHAEPPTSGWNPKCPVHGRKPSRVSYRAKRFDMSKQRKTRRPGRRGGGSRRR